jgi:hypothetical protein
MSGSRMRYVNIESRRRLRQKLIWYIRRSTTSWTSGLRIRLWRCRRLLRRWKVRGFRSLLGMYISHFSFLSVSTAVALHDALFQVAGLVGLHGSGRRRQDYEHRKAFFQASRLVGLHGSGRRRQL